VRTAGVLAFMGLHFGIWLTMDIGIFPWISAFCMVCFLPGWFWDRALALRSVSLRRIGPARRLQLATAARLVRTTGASARARLSSVTGAGQLLFAGPTLRAGNGVPHATAAGTTGRDETAVGHETRHHAPGEEPEPVRLRSSLATNLLALVFVLYVLCWNLTTVSAFTLPERAAPLGPFLGLDQSWGMFAPSPSSEDGWFVMPGNLRDGQRVDLMPVTRDDYRPHGVSWEKPQDITSTFENEHWRKYLENIYSAQHAEQRLYFGQYVCREWNVRHTGDDTLTTFRITYMLEETLPDYRQSEPEKVELWKHIC
jgi:hypothetical protein